MGIRIHSLILATSLVATVAVGIASASVFDGAMQKGVAPKGDRLPVATVATDVDYVTVETRQPGRQIVTEYHARQILIKPSEIVTPEQAEKKAQDLYTRIVDKHEDFAKLAKDESKDNTTANNGGDMGWFAKDAWGQAIAAQIDQLKDNEVSHPIQTDAGWIVLQRLGTRQSDMTDQLQRDQARQAIGNRKADEAYENYLRELRSSSFVDIRVPELKDPDDKQASATP